MGVLGLVIGPSGSGKSTSLINLVNYDIKVFGATGKRLPFRTQKTINSRAGYRDIYDSLLANESRCYVIDDSTYLMQFDNFRRAKEKGYDKYTTMSVSFEKLLEASMDTDFDTTVYFLHHPQFSDAGATKPQTVGRMIDNQLNMEGLFDIILECGIEDGRHVFFTNEHGIAKTPLHMFHERVIDNDLYAVDETLREYWGMKKLAEGGSNAD